MERSSEGIACFFEGRRASEDDVKEAAVTVWVSRSQHDQEVRAFRSEETYRDWIGGTEHKLKAVQIEGMLQMARSSEKQDHSRARRVLESRARWVQQELELLASETGLRPFSVDLLRRASIETPFIEGPITNTAFCHEHRNGTGGVVGISFLFPVPDFGWWPWRMNDKASSLTFTPAGGVLTEHPWYRGRRFVFLGMHMWHPPMQLSFAGFEDIASAGFCI